MTATRNRHRNPDHPTPGPGPLPRHPIRGIRPNRRGHRVPTRYLPRPCRRTPDTHHPYQAPADHHRSPIRTGHPRFRIPDARHPTPARRRLPRRRHPAPALCPARIPLSHRSRPAYRIKGSGSPHPAGRGSHTRAPEPDTGRSHDRRSPLPAAPAGPAAAARVDRCRRPRRDPPVPSSGRTPVATTPLRAGPALDPRPSPARAAHRARRVIQPPMTGYPGRSPWSEGRQEGQDHGLRTRRTAATQ